MMRYQKLDAWKSGHDLVIAVLEGTEDYKGPEKRMVRRLGYLAIRAVGRVAFGKGTGNRKMFLQALMRAQGYLSEFQYQLSLARAMDVLPEALCTKCDALRGRATFYAQQLFEKVLSGPGRGRPRE